MKEYRKKPSLLHAHAWIVSATDDGYVFKCLMNTELDVNICTQLAWCEWTIYPDFNINIVLNCSMKVGIDSDFLAHGVQHAFRNNRKTTLDDTFVQF